MHFYALSSQLQQTFLEQKLSQKRVYKTLVGINLEKSNTMFIFKPLLTTFDVSIIFWDGLAMVNLKKM